jgi:RNA polymerase sigma-70 factor (ECF subfamily)
MHRADPRRLERLYDDHAAAVLAYARRRAPHTADEVLSETFVVAWRRLDDVPRGGERTWLLGVARRVLANQHRGQRRRDALSQRLTAHLTPSGTGTGDELELDVLAAVAALPERQREVVRLVFWDDLTPAETAAVLGTTSLAVRSRLHRALQALRRTVPQTDLLRPSPQPLDSPGDAHAVR